MEILGEAWRSCAHCGVSMPLKHCDAHETCCIDTVADQDKLEQFHSGFILNGILHAIVGRFRKDLRKHFPPMYRPIVLMHPSTMKIFGLHKATLVLLKKGNEEKIHRCWPSNSIEVSTIVFPNANSFICCVGDKVVLQYFNEICDVAYTVFFSTNVQKDFVTSEIFTKSILKEFDGFIVKPGMNLRYSHFGYPCDLAIRKISGCTTKCSDVPFRPDIDQMTADLAQLNVKDESPSSEPENSNSNCNITLKQRLQQTKPWDFNDPTGITFEYFEISHQTNIVIEVCTKDNCLEQEKVLFSAIGGLGKQINEIKEIISMFLNNTGYFPRKILLNGAPGTGKTFTATAIANEFKPDIEVLHVKSSDIFLKYPEESAEALKSKFRDASIRSPCILFFDDIHTLFPQLPHFSHCMESYMANTFRVLLEELIEEKRYAKVLVLAATSTPKDVDRAVRIKFRKQIEFDTPNMDGRREIIQKILCNAKHDLTDVQISEISESSSKYTGADLLRVYNKAGMKAAEQTIVRGSFVVTFNDMMDTLKEVKPSSMSKYQFEVPHVLWEDIGGMDQVKHEIQSLVAMPLKHREAYERLGISPPRAVLLFGPPGCSKTMIAKALANENKFNFISVKGPELFNKFVGESERNIKNIFSDARSAAPCIIFFDEVDSLTAEKDSSEFSTDVRRRVISQFSREMGRIAAEDLVIILGATNCPDMIHKSLMRPGRFDCIVYVPLPDSLTRKAIFKLQLAKLPTAADVSIEELVERTEGYSGAEIVAVCNEASLLAFSEEISLKKDCCVTAHHLKKALIFIPPRTSKERIAFYEEYNKMRNAFVSWHSWSSGKDVFSFGQ